MCRSRLAGTRAPCKIHNVGCDRHGYKLRSASTFERLGHTDRTQNFPARQTHLAAPREVRLGQITPLPVIRKVTAERSKTPTRRSPPALLRRLATLTAPGAPPIASLESSRLSSGRRLLRQQAREPLSQWLPRP
jgi:hypothetical protein